MVDFVWDEGASCGGKYYQKVWILETPGGAHFDGDACVIQVNDKYYAAPADWTDQEHDVGPFDDLDEAKAVAIVLWRTGAYAKCPGPA